MEKQVFTEKMQAVAGLLGFGWEEEATHYTNHGYFIGQDQVKISARNDDYSHKGRIAFSSAYPRGKVGYGAATSRDNIEITVSEDKIPERIAKDIQSRFLPTYLENLEKVIEANRAADDYEARKLATLKKIADYLGEEIRNSCIYPKMKEIYKIEHDGGFLQLEIRHCTPEKCIELIEVLRRS